MRRLSRDHNSQLYGKIEQKTQVAINENYNIILQDKILLGKVVYEDFIPGELVMKNNDKVQAAFNIHLQDGELHYLKGDNILFVNIAQIKEVTIGIDRYIPTESKMMKVISQKDDNYLLKNTQGDFDALFVGTGAYGSNANTQAVRNLSSIEIGGKSIVNHAILLQNKEEGKELPILEKYYFLINNKCVLAHKKTIEKEYVKDHNTWKIFLKDNKIKWHREESLIKVLHFFSKRSFY